MSDERVTKLAAELSESEELQKDFTENPQAVLKDRGIEVNDSTASLMKSIMSSEAATNNFGDHEAAAVLPIPVPVRSL